MNERRTRSISKILSQAVHYPNVGDQKSNQYVLNLADLQPLDGGDRLRLNDLFSPAAWSSVPNLALFDIVRVIDKSAGLDVDLVLQRHGVGAVLGFRGMDNPGLQ